ncbi:hypothetical protein Rhe02_49830 [Rhizocola hellebori]|uniref:Uncharacterized protein n=1 Tax=Rhizocola hellebori TaxID=1392758 RepID=A0A8J3QAH0_9ACTN|nr:hypothetical protein [Rhizocola hellebori]GIH06916.1 hypothetical protein Rhe02_49830 [Rhizocola hellebori]
MHDLDRAMFESAAAGQEMGQPEHREQQEFLEVLGGLLREPGRQAETYESYELGQEMAGSHELVERTTHEAALAGELLEAHEAGELEQFLGNLISRAGSAVRNFARSDTGKALGGILKNAAKQALPVIGKGIGGAIGPQYAGLGERIGKGAGTIFGLELESLSNEDREFEVAKAFVRFANEAARRAAQAQAQSKNCGPPQAVAKAAATLAAKRFAPGLLGKAVLAAPAAGSTPGGAHGQWVRRGNQIVIFGV